MKHKVFILLGCCLLWCTTAFAHVMTQDNIYEDLTYSQAPKDVLLANALGIVSYEDDKYIYRSQDVLTMKELAAWAASYHKLSGDDKEALANAALQEGLVASLTGDATYEAVNAAFFHHKLTVEDPQATMTRDQFAQFVIAQATVDLDGHTLYDMSQFTVGPTGVIEAVKAVDKQAADGKTKKVYELTIDGTVYELGMHPRVHAETVDPLVWEGMTVTTSWFGPNVATDQAGMHQQHQHGEHGHTEEAATVTSNEHVATIALQYMELQAAEKAVSSEEKETKQSTSETPAAHDHEEQPQEEQSITVWWVIGGVVALLLAVLLYSKKRKKNEAV